MVDYKAQLEDPLWKKFSEEVKERAEWKCEECGSIGKPLHSHHKLYVKGRKAWQYNLECMECLCEECHQDFHNGESVEEFRKDGHCIRCGAIRQDPEDEYANESEYFCDDCYGWHLHQEEQDERLVDQANEEMKTCGTISLEEFEKRCFGEDCSKTQ